MKSRWVPICCAFISLCLIFCTSAFAGDELYLCGVVKEVNTQKSTVRIQVTSESCRGEKIFKVVKVQQLNRFSVGESRCFSINAASCRGQQIATIRAE